MSFARRVAFSLSLLLAAGCAGGGGTVAPIAPQPPRSAPQSAALYPAASSAARHILGGIESTRSAQRRDDGREDDGDWHALNLPVLQSCGNGILATDCSVWSFTDGRAGRSRATASVTLARPPVLNFCRDAGMFPADLGTPAQPMLGIGTSAFSLRYTGTKPAPIVSFATHWWDVTLTNTFTGNATTAKAIALTPVTSDTAYRGWLVFFTWSWPADILAVPFAVNEIQLGVASSPLTIPAGGSAQLGAFDCLGRPVAASAAGTGFGFNPDHSGTQRTSATNELNVPVYGGANAAGAISLSDDRGARTTDPVTAGAPATPPPTGR